MVYYRPRRNGRRTTVRRTYRKKPRGLSKKRYKKGNKIVRMRLLRQIVPRPEIKFHEAFNFVWENTTSTMTQWGSAIAAFNISQGDAYYQREGDQIRIKMVRMELETRLYPGNAVLTELEITGGSVGFANTIGVLSHDQAIRLACIDDMVVIGTGLGASPWPVREGNSVQSNADGGGSDYYSLLDKKAMKIAKRPVHFDKHLWHARGVPLNAAPAGAATLSGPIGMPPSPPVVKKHIISFKYPGLGKLMKFHPASNIPSSQPIFWICGKNALTNTNPQIRVARMSVYFTDC